MDVITKFKGEQCPVCSERFADADDVVVCPECGTPHHRSCYLGNGDCANGSRHAEGGFEWKSRLAGIITVLEERERRDESERARLREEEEKREAEDFEKRVIYGVSRAEFAAYMGISVNTYEYKLKIAHIRKISVNFFAGLLMPFYQFYKGMRLFGALMTFFVFLIYLPTVLYANFNIDLLYKFLISCFGTPETASSFLSSVQFAVCILLVFFNDYVYLRFCAVKIKKIRKNHPEGGDGYYEELRARGAPSIGRAFADAFAVSLFLAAAVFAFVVAFFPNAATGG
ncbi:MAG: hypothetical protein LBI36_02790 [Oscillospiraceae bacterium]|nr:hypothetical protein [Oscillospiraceae bacterium]